MNQEVFEISKITFTISRLETILKKQLASAYYVNEDDVEYVHVLVGIQDGARTLTGAAKFLNEESSSYVSATVRIVLSEGYDSICIVHGRKRMKIRVVNTISDTDLLLHHLMHSFMIDFVESETSMETIEFS